MVEHPVFLSSSIVYSPLAPFIQAPTKLWFKTAVLVQNATAALPVVVTLLVSGNHESEFSASPMCVIRG